LNLIGHNPPGGLGTGRFKSVWYLYPHALSKLVALVADHFYRVNAKYGEDATIQSGIKKGTITGDDESLIREYLNEKHVNHF
jgi:hypothetical protein